MKTFVRHLVTALTVAVACQAGIAMAEDFYWVSTDAKAAAPAVPEKAAAPAQSACTSCCEGTCCEESTGCCGCDLGCDECPCRGLVGFAGVDTFKGVSNAFLPNNLGAVAGLNAAIPVPGLSDYGIGWQLGMSYGVYDFDGRVSAVNPAQSEEQTFVTTGFYHKAACDSRLSFGMVYDWMLNSNWRRWAPLRLSDSGVARSNMPSADAMPWVLGVADGTSAPFKRRPCWCRA